LAESRQIVCFRVTGLHCFGWFQNCNELTPAPLFEGKRGVEVLRGVVMQASVGLRNSILRALPSLRSQRNKHGEMSEGQRGFRITGLHGLFEEFEEFWVSC